MEALGDTEGSIILTSKGEPALDGLMIASGWDKGNDKHLIVWASHSKIVSSPGPIESTILPKMREAVKSLKRARPTLASAVTVYDIFSDRPHSESRLKLEPDEVVLITDSRNLDVVLGGYASRKRPLDSEPKAISRKRKRQ